MNNNDLKTIHIDQLLHGYDEGHRMLSGSIKPDSLSAKTLLFLSDLSGQGSIAKDVEYITGYPLPKMGAYALGKTWMAPEMSRPGCVWTHTLLIDFSDLTAICDNTILKLFQRPAGSHDILSYAQPLLLKSDSQVNTHCQLSCRVIASLLEALYESPMDCVFVQRQENLPADEIVMAIWLQQWPRLRRNFRFCTWTSSDRSQSDEQFDLQFVPHKKDIRNMNRKGNVGIWVDSSNVSSNMKNWAEIAASDVISIHCNNHLRDFLWRYGAETDAGRAAFSPLAQVWQALEGGSILDIDSLVIAVSSLKPAITSLTLRVMRELVKSATVEEYDISSNAIEFLIRNLALWGDQMEEDFAAVIATMIWRHAPEKIWHFFKSDTVAERLVAATASKKMHAADVLEGAKGNIDLFCTVLKTNLKLATSPLIWDAPHPIPQKAAEIISESGYLDDSILISMMEAENTDVPALGLDIFGQAAVDAAIVQYDSNDVENQYHAHRWLLAAKMNPNLILRAISKVSIKHIETLGFVASLVDYHYPSTSDTKDEWATALIAIENDIGRANFEFYAFLLSRALSGHSPEPGLLIHLAFDFIHSDLLKSQYPTTSWSMLERELPEVPWWKTWDRAHRVRLGVVNFFVKRNLPPKEFFQITNDKDVFDELVDIANSSIAGRTYIKGLSSWTQQTQN